MYKNNMADILEEIPKAQMVMLTHLAQDYDILKICKLNQTSDEVLSLRQCSEEMQILWKHSKHSI